MTPPKFPPRPLPDPPRCPDCGLGHNFGATTCSGCGAAILPYE